MLIVILVVLFVLFLVGRHNDRYDWSALTIVSFWLCLFGSGAYIITYASSVSSNAALRAFASENRTAYRETFVLTKRMVAGDSTRERSPAVDAPAWEQVKIASERLKEYRDNVAMYNQTLREKREYASNWFLRMWITPPPSELNYIKFDIK